MPSTGRGVTSGPGMPGWFLAAPVKANVSNQG